MKKESFLEYLNKNNFKELLEKETELNKNCKLIFNIVSDLNEYLGYKIFNIECNLETNYLFGFITIRHLESNLIIFNIKFFETYFEIKNLDLEYCDAKVFTSIESQKIFQFFAENIKTPSILGKIQVAIEENKKKG
jgi:hypothetical protein